MCCNLCLMTCNTFKLVWGGVWNIFTMLNYFTHLTNFKHFGSSTCSQVLIQSHDTCGQHKTGDWIWTYEHVEDPKCLKFLRYFCFYSASTKTSFGFCSCSELLQLKFGEKKTLHGNTNCSARNKATGVSKVLNERYLPYLQLRGKALMKIFMYFWYKSGRKLR